MLFRGENADVGLVQTKQVPSATLLRVKLSSNSMHNGNGGKGVWTYVS